MAAGALWRFGEEKQERQLAGQLTARSSPHQTDACQTYLRSSETPGIELDIPSLDMHRAAS